MIFKRKRQKIINKNSIVIYLIVLRLNCSCSEKEVLPIYHCATGLKSVSNGQLLEKGLTYALQNPYDELIWRPDCEVTKCFSYFYLLIMIKQVFPSFVIDKIFKITRKKPR